MLFLSICRIMCMPSFPLPIGILALISLSIRSKEGRENRVYIAGRRTISCSQKATPASSCSYQHDGRTGKLIFKILNLFFVRLMYSFGLLEYGCSVLHFHLVRLSSASNLSLNCISLVVLIIFLDFAHYNHFVLRFSKLS